MSPSPVSSPNSTCTCFPVLCFFLHYSHQTKWTLFLSTYLSPIFFHIPILIPLLGLIILLSGTHEIYTDLVTPAFGHMRYIRIWWHLPLKSTLMYMRYKLYNVKLSIHMLFTIIHVAVLLANLLISHFPHVSSSRIPYNKSTNSQTTGSRPETPIGFLPIPPSYIAMPRILFNEILSNEEMNDEWALYFSFGVSPLANYWLNM